MSPWSLAFLLLVMHTAAIADSEWPQQERTAALEATVRVSDPDRHATGSGVVIGREAGITYVLTAYHLVENARRLEVTTFGQRQGSPREQTYHKVTVVAVAGGVRDLALLRVAAEGRLADPVRLCPNKAVPVDPGFRALAVGCAEGAAPTASVRTVSSRKPVRRPTDRRPAFCWEVEGKRKPGQSGGGLFDRQGRLLGLGSGNSQDKSYFIHIQEIQRFLQENDLNRLGE